MIHHIQRWDEIGLSCKISNQTFVENLKTQLIEKRLEKCRNKKLHDQPH